MSGRQARGRAHGRTMLSHAEPRARRCNRRCCEKHLFCTRPACTASRSATVLLPSLAAAGRRGPPVCRLCRTGKQRERQRRVDSGVMLENAAAWAVCTSKRPLANIGSGRRGPRVNFWCIPSSYSLARLDKVPLTHGQGRAGRRGVKEVPNVGPQVLSVVSFTGRGPISPCETMS